MHIWIAFFACTALIVYSGSKLSKYGDMLAEKSGLGRTWMGVVLMASVTSLPELVTGLGSVTYAKAPDIAVGDVLGSCVFNLLILAFLDLLQRPAPISARAHHGQVLSSSFGILLLSVSAIGLFAGGEIPPVGWIGAYSFLIIFIYLVAMRLVYSYEKRLLKETKAELNYRGVSLRRAVIGYAVNAVLVAAAAVFLPSIGKALAVATGLGQTFVGTVFIALSTSLPEVVVSISAVKMGAIDLAIGNLFGSNLFDIFILAVDDIFFYPGPLLSFVSGNNIVTALSATAMTAIAGIGIVYRAEKKRLFLAWDSIGIIAVYAVNFVLMLVLGGNER